MDSIKEKWKPIKGYEGLYEISNKGRVKSLKLIKNVYTTGHTRANVVIEREKILKPTSNGVGGYLIIGLKKDGKRKNHYIHRLVANAFIDNPENKSVINHKDYNRENNNASNLEWCTQKENTNYSAHHMKKQHLSKTATGERYITYRKKQKLYRVNIKAANVDKSFKTLAEAIEFRNEVLNEINYTI